MSDPHEEIVNLIENDSPETGLAKKQNWKAALLRSEHGALKPLLANAITVLRHSPDFAGVIKWDDFASRIVLVERPPWESASSSWKSRTWTSNDDIQTANWLQHSGIAINVAVSAQAVTAVGDDYRFHPVIEYLDQVEWDGEPRLNNWLTRFLGAAADNYHSDIGRCLLIAAVARIRRPGCKVDTMPILEGAQGLGKSTLLRTLFEPWYSDEIADFGSKDAAMQLCGAWLIEVSELDAMTRSEVGRVKSFISRMTDRYRSPYGSRVIERPRSCVFWGTTNSDSYLKDETGGGRFWPIKTNVVDIDGLKAVRDQLWAEAQSRFSSGEPWWLQDRDVQRAAAEEQRARYVGDPWDPIISEYVSTRSVASVSEILKDVLKLSPEYWTQNEQNRVARCLKALDFERFQKRAGKDKPWHYRRKKPVS